MKVRDIICENEADALLRLVDPQERDMAAQAGRLIASGCFRSVFEHRTDPALVLKLEKRSAPMGSRGYKQNVKEWDIWRAAEKSALADWFAPCAAISGGGNVLLQQRAAPLAACPAQVPRLFGEMYSVDLNPAHHLENWGELGGRPVVCDYALLGELTRHLRAIFSDPWLAEPVRPRIEPTRKGKARNAEWRKKHGLEMLA